METDIEGLDYAAISLLGPWRQTDQGHIGLSGGGRGVEGVEL